MANRKNNLSTKINGEEVPDVIQYCFDRISESIAFKDTLVPPNNESGISSDFIDYHAELKEWSTGEMKLPDGMSTGDGVITGENHIWEAIQTIETAIWEKNYNLEHQPEGAEDPKNDAMIVSAVRGHKWFLDGCSDFAREKMMDAVYHGTAVWATHQYYSDSEPVGRQRTIDIDPAAIWWDIDAKNDFHNARWICYSEMLPVAEVENEWNVRIKNPEELDESKYSIEYSRRLRIEPTNNKKASDKSVSRMVRVFYFWLYDTTIGKLDESPVLEDAPITERKKVPAQDESGTLISQAQAGVAEDAELVEEDGQLFYVSNIPMTTGSGKVLTLPTPKKNSKGQGITLVKKGRIYPFGRLISFTSNTLLYDGRNPYKLDFLRQRSDGVTMKVPISWIHVNKLPGQVWGKSYIEIMLDDQISINIAENQVRINAKLTGNSPLAVNKDKLVSPKIDEDPEDISFQSTDTFVVQNGSPGDAIARIKQEPLSQQHLENMARRINVARNKAGTSEQLIRGIAPASDPASKTEFLTNLALRRMVKFFRSTQSALVRWEEIRLSLFKQFQKLSPFADNESQNVDFKTEMLDNYHAKIRMLIDDSSFTRNEKNQARIARTIEQGGQVLSTVPGAAGALLDLYFESLEIQGFEEKMQKYAQLEQSVRNQQVGGNGDGNSSSIKQSRTAPRQAVEG